MLFEMVFQMTFVPNIYLSAYCKNVNFKYNVNTMLLQHLKSLKIKLDIIYSKYTLYIQKIFPLDKINVTKNTLFFLLLRAAHSFTSNSQFLYVLKHKVYHFSKSVSGTFHF